jgi:hypothetical protein
MAAVDVRANPLEVGLEPPRPDVMGVAESAADHGSLATDFTSLCHDATYLDRIAELAGPMGGLTKQ